MFAVHCGNCDEEVVCITCLSCRVVCNSGSRSYKTFKPKKHIAEGSHQFELMKYAMQTLGSGNLRLAVALPEGEDLNEWVAVNSKSHYVYTTETRLNTYWANLCLGPFVTAVTEKEKLRKCVKRKHFFSDSFFLLLLFK